jgi:ABC-type oligopeptide transport system ATPase subunit
LKEAASYVAVRDLRRVFDISRPWLNRVIEGRGKQYVRAVDGVSFDIARGETFALVGESGSGKSTVARMVVGLLSPSAGGVAIDGIAMAGRKSEAARRRLRRRIQMIFQDPYASLNPRWRVKDIIAEPMRTLGLARNRSEVEQRVADLLRKVRLDPSVMRKFPHEFSGGQRQRIAIARALSSQPEFIVCDEPTSALDVSVQAQVLDLMSELQAEFGLTYLLISHNLAVVRQMSTSVGVLHNGVMVERGPTDAIFDSPQADYTKMLLDAVPDISKVA